MAKSIRVELRSATKIYGETAAIKDVNLEIQEGEFFSILGPSGSGKTTILRAIAGLAVLSAGEIQISGQSMRDIPVYKRELSIVFQNYALFPHMNVFENVAFGLRMRRMEDPEIRKRVKEALELVRLPGMEDRRPNQLSGGQQQRVALARAIVTHPKVLLLDEPLGALDKNLRANMQVELKILQRELGITTVMVTHDQEEALSLSDRIAVIDRGCIEQVGTPVEIYESPANCFVANFIGGTNLFSGVIRDRISEGVQLETSDGLSIWAKEAEQKHTGEGKKTGDQAFVAIRPEKISLTTVPPSEKENVFEGTIANIVYMGASTILHVRIGGKLMIVNEKNATPESAFSPGQKVFLSWRRSVARLLRH